MRLRSARIGTVVRGSMTMLAGGCTGFPWAGAPTSWIITGTGRSGGAQPRTRKTHHGTESEKQHPPHSDSQIERPSRRCLDALPARSLNGLLASLGEHGVNSGGGMPLD